MDQDNQNYQELLCNAKSRLLLASEYGIHLGFKSLLKCYVEVLEKAGSSDENDKDAYFQVLRDNADIITFQDNGMYDLKVENKLVSALTNREGILFVGKHAYKFTDFGQIIVLSGDTNQFIGITPNSVSTKEISVSVHKRKLLAKCGLGRAETAESSNRKGILRSV